MGPDSLDGDEKRHPLAFPPAAEIDHSRTVSEKPAVFAEWHQLAGLHLVKYAQLGDLAAAAGDVERPRGVY
jgi:hypothetical protein